MKRRIKTLARAMLLLFARNFGARIIDQRTGQSVGRAFIIPWRGKIWVFGLETPVFPVFQPEDRVRHWRQIIGFASHPPPDFPHEPRP